MKGKRTEAPRQENPDLLSGILVKKIFKDFSRKIRNIRSLRKTPLVFFVSLTKILTKNNLYIPFSNNNSNKKPPVISNNNSNKKHYIRIFFVREIITLTKKDKGVFFVE